MADHTYFITGLCMQGNKGGPAIALSLTHAIKQHIPEAKFIFSVPSGSEFEHETIWADRYGYRVVENIDLRHVVPPFAFAPGKIKRLKHWSNALRDSKAMIQMSAISYVGPPSSNPRLRNLLSGRFMDFYMSGLFNRPMLAWTQSYGPLSTRLVKFFAAWDLKRQPIIFCRGDDCLAAVQELVPGKKAISYPDIAVMLPYDQQWAQQYLQKQSWPSEGFVTISPSAVLYSKSKLADGRNAHIEYLKAVCVNLRQRGIPILIVPHTFRPGRHNPTSCDFGVSLELVKQLQNLDGLFLVEDDLSPIELKSLISLAHFHIGGRYHSVVAALSSKVPAISLSWHPKYKDLMRAYGVEDFVIQEAISSPQGIIDTMQASREMAAQRIAQAHQQVVQQSHENVANFVKLLKDLP